ncbi:MAG: DUF512 domain-containing protein [Lachnospiraceae bacterium]|nr:DUF512 domain-containing protein [Lachnospiraceae bacterium]
MTKKGHTIICVPPGSLAEELELVPGDTLLEIGGHEIKDIFDYQYYMEETYVELLVRKADGEEWFLEVEKDEDEDLGVAFENGLMDEYRSCRNRCMFCFIDQMPPGMRETLYFKDDDSRLSFLQGNYITLTNMSDDDIDRIIAYRLAPINVSVHTMNPKLRCRMLHNRFAGEALKKLSRLYEAGVEMNGQIVLCKGINDREELDATIEALGRFLPHMQSVSVVPVGLTRYREGLYPLEPLSKEEMEDTISRIERWQEVFYEKFSCHFVHASDEFYLMTGRPLPEEERYDGYLQLENGVGMLRLLETEVQEALLEEPFQMGSGLRKISIATGELAAPFIRKLANQVCEKFPGLHVSVYAIENRFFGERITVSGLITGQDLLHGLKGKELGERLLVPVNMFKSGEEIFLDDISLKEVESVLQTEIDVVKSSGWDFVNALAGVSENGGPENENSAYDRDGSGRSRKGKSADSKSRYRPYEGVNG